LGNAVGKNADNPMPQITNIEFRRRKPQRFIVHFDDDEVHTFSPETALKHGFVLEKEFSDEEFVEIIKEDNIRRAKDQVLRYLEVRPHSRKELSLKLLRKSYRKEIIEIALSDLEKVDLIDDENFTRQFIQNELTLRPSSKKLLRSKLLQRGVAVEIFDPILDKAYDEHDEEQIALRIAGKFLKTQSGIKKERKKEKLMRHLVNKGFDWEVIDWVTKENGL
jgi:regulatory protein